MFEARLGTGGPTTGADGRLLAEDGELSRHLIGCLLGKQEPERTLPGGGSQAEEEAAGMQSGPRTQLSVRISPGFRADAWWPRALEKP